MFHWIQVALSRPLLHRTLQRAPSVHWVSVRTCETTDHHFGHGVLARETRGGGKCCGQAPQLYHPHTPKRHHLGACRQHWQRTNFNPRTRLRDGGINNSQSYEPRAADSCGEESARTTERAGLDLGRDTREGEGRYGPAVCGSGGCTGGGGDRYS